MPTKSPTLIAETSPTTFGVFDSTLVEAPARMIHGPPQPSTTIKFIPTSLTGARSRILPPLPTVITIGAGVAPTAGYAAGAVASIGTADDAGAVAVLIPVVTVGITVVVVADAVGTIALPIGKRLPVVVAGAIKGDTVTVVWQVVDPYAPVNVPVYVIVFNGETVMEPPLGDAVCPSP